MGMQTATLFKWQPLPNRLSTMHGFHREGGRAQEPQHGAVYVLGQQLW